MHCVNFPYDLIMTMLLLRNLQNKNDTNSNNLNNLLAGENLVPK